MSIRSWFTPRPRKQEIHDAEKQKEAAENAQSEVIALARDLRAELERFAAERAKQ